MTEPTPLFVGPEHASAITTEGDLWNALVLAGCEPSRAGDDGFKARCPLPEHVDSTPSSSWSVLRAGKVLGYCFVCSRAMGGAYFAKAIAVLERASAAPDAVQKIKANPLHELGHVATTTPGGANKPWKREWSEGLSGAQVYVVADADEPGRRHARAVARALDGVALSVHVAEPEPPFNDVSEAVAALGGVLPRFVGLPPEPEPAPDSQLGLREWTAASLLAMDLPEQRWAIPGLLPAGLALLAGAPKIGKSWLLLDLCLAVASGGKALSAVQVEQGPVLYLALEDTARRLKVRLQQLLKGMPGPADLHLRTEWSRMDEGGAERLVEFLTEHPATRLVCVDVLSKVRSARAGETGAYDADYDAMSAMKAVADKFDVALLVNHHDRKAKSEDWLSSVSGTRGITGAADAVALLIRPRGRADGELWLTGRDVEEKQTPLSFEAGAWRLLVGSVEEYRMATTRQQIVSLLTAEPGLSPAEVSDRVEGLSRDNAKQTMLRMRNDGQLVADEQGRYSLSLPSPVTGQVGKAVTGDSSDTDHDPEDPETAFNALPRVCDEPGCARVGDGVVHFGKPWWVIRCMEHNPIKQSRDPSGRTDAVSVPNNQEEK